MENNEKKIYKRKDGKWVARYIKRDENGIAKYSYIYAYTYEEVNAKLLFKLSNPPKSVSTTNITVTELLEKWMISQKSKVKQSTYSAYYRIIHSHILPDIGRFDVLDLKNSMIENLLSQKLTNGRLDRTGGLSPKTVQDILIIIKSACKFARTIGYDVCISDVNLKTKVKKKRIKVITKKDQWILEQNLRSDIDNKKAGILLCLYTGLRIGEICALCWDDICLKTNIIKITKTLQRIKNIESEDCKTKLIVDTPKSLSSIREIPIPSFLTDILKKLKSDEKSYFLSGSSDKIVEPRSYENNFKNYTKQSGINKVNFHMLRHTFATRCIEHGVDVKSLSEILGHSDIKITLNTYVHPTMDMKREGIEKLVVSYNDKVS